MNIREFEYLILIAEYKSITKAANQLFISQSALSKFVLKKEASLGIPLFNRIGKQFIPTYAGKIYIESAKKILSIYNQIEKDVGQIAHGGKEHIHLGFHSSWSNFFFALVYPTFQNLYPNVELKVSEVNSNDALRMLDEGELDLAIASVAWTHNIKYNIDQLRSHRMVLAVRKGHALIEQSSPDRDSMYPLIDVRSLEGMPLIMRQSDQKSYEYTMSLLHSYGIKPRIALETASRENTLRAIEYGVGVTFILDDPLPKMVYKDVTYLSIKGDVDIKAYSHILYNKGTQLSPITKDLKNLITTSYQQILQK